MLVTVLSCFLLAIAIRVSMSMRRNKHRELKDWHYILSLPWWSYGQEFGKAVESIEILASSRGGANALQMSSVANQRAHFERAMRHSYRGISAPTVKRDMRCTPA
ncbi:hypothetical protein B0H17DRAFT_1040602 [Mycena rosella]|uniref:Secreted protein n=1 Tax=Mycena rosella TaxID=1033263 RepID=A0AAD7M708_MYCRO|nr:hypothetical protein B0H17DRAFT_1040602 [Mycena rosella]